MHMLQITVYQLKNLDQHPFFFTPFEFELKLSLLQQIQLLISIIGNN